MAVGLVTRYEDGFLPSAGGWMEQDHFYVMLIEEGLAAKRNRERINEQRKAALAKRH